MNTRIVSAIILSGCVFLVNAQTASPAPWGAVAAKLDAEWTVEDMLRYAIEDEYLAKAEYAAIIGKYGQIRPFTNIVKSEETHISLLIDAYRDAGLSVPQDQASSHIHVPATLQEAFATGVEAEIANIDMYARFLETDLLRRAENAELKSLFQRLKDASGKHLEAFRRGLSRS